MNAEPLPPMAGPRIGVMGGMFDPVHSGHLDVALTALRLLALDQLRLIPCHVPNHRDPATASSEHRLAMLQLAAAGEARLQIDQREVARDGVSYTVDTLASLRDEFPSSALVLVVGMDAFAGLASWYRWREIFTLAHLLVISRPLPQPPSWGDGLAQELRRRQVASPADMFGHHSGAILISEALQVDISSTQVRNRLQEGGNVDALLPTAVKQYIEENRLYR